ncbi:MAG: hypothetical protein ACRC8S_07920 [Fimbriiglobus sp.]
MRLVILLILFVVGPVAAQPPKVNIEDWTPRPATGKAEPWEKKRDPEWDDARFLQSDTGPAFNATYKYSLQGQVQMVYKGTGIKIPLGQAIGTAVYDRCLNRFVTITTGPIQHSPKRFALLNTPTPTGQTLYAVSIAPGATINTSATKYLGMYDSIEGISFRTRTQNQEELQFLQPQNGTLTPMKRAFQKPPAPHAKRWGEPIVTPLMLGDDKGPFALDTLTIPYENRFKALFFCTGVDFLPDGRVAICTAHGDVWLVKVDEKAKTCAWSRFATGLYQPLGLKVVDAKIMVIERGQLTRLHDFNQDDEADYYESFNSDWHNGGGEHSYDSCLETDPTGNFYFHKTGDTHTPSGGCVLRVLKDGSKCEIFATGTRHPIGLGMSPTGIVTGADQEGNWMPATRIDQYKPGGFYGDMRAHHRATPPKTYDLPLCWLPREVDNSAGGQVWVPEKTFGALAGLPLHLSYGRCKPFVLLREERGDVVQGGVWDLGVKFLSGICRARFHPTDGSMYAVGLNGWQTAATADGCLQRLRATGKPMNAVTRMKTLATGLELTFSESLDPASVSNIKNYQAAMWGYRWSGQYGSKRYGVLNPNAEGQDVLSVSEAKLLEDGRTVRITIPNFRPAMQMQIGLNILTKDQQPLTGLATLTIHEAK